MTLIFNQADLCRFRCICKSWRSFTFSTQPHPLFPLALSPLQTNSRPCSLSPTLLCLLSSSPQNRSHNFWLVKVSQTGRKRWALLNILTKHKLYFPSGVLRHRISLLDFGNYEVGRSYQLQLVGDGGEGTFNFEEFSPSIALRKVAVKTGGQFVVLVLYGYGQIALWRLGNKNWEIVETGQNDGNDKKEEFDDITCFDGKFHGVDRRARLSVIDATTFELAEVAAPMEDCGGQCTHLV